MMNKKTEKIVEKKTKNISSTNQAFHPQAASFWDCQTKEDRIARNLWLCFTMGILAVSCLILTLNKTAHITSLLGLS